MVVSFDWEKWSLDRGGRGLICMVGCVIAVANVCSRDTRAIVGTMLSQGATRHNAVNGC
jgi:hypothetical protein